MTEKLYYQDTYLKEFTAVTEQVSVSEKEVRVSLDRTAFYPEGGGQPADTGMIRTNDGTAFAVYDTQEDNGVIWHYIKTADTSLIPQPGDQVTGIIDWVRRFDHMQQHSGEHIVSGMIFSRFNCDNTGFHMGEETVEIDYNARISFEEALEIEREANEYIWQDHAFTEIWPSAEELKEIHYRSKKELEGDVRITSFPGADICACCGTHVRSSGQVGLVKFISAKNFHEGTRLELLCGKRAADYLAMNFRENKAVAVMLSTNEENTSEYAGKLISENIKLKADLSALEEKLFERWAESFSGQECALIIEDWMTPAQGRRLADILADRCAAAAVFTKSENGYNYSVIKRDSDISDMIKEMNSALDGRGGGKNGFAQGSVKSGKERIKEFINRRM